MDGLFAPQRTLGLACSTLPFAVHTEGQQTYVSMPLGNTFVTYYTDHLQIRYLGPPLSRAVNAVAAYKDLILAAVGNTISGWHKVKQVKTYTGSDSAISELLVFGEFLIALNFTGQALVWNAESEELVQTLQLQQQGVCLCHPPTYLNKVLIASKRLLTLYNIKTAAAIYDYPALQAKLHSDIICLDPAPALDLIGIGLSDGQVLVWNVKTDTEVLELKQETKVTALSFCTGTEEVMATGDQHGVVYLWNLAERRLQATIVAHSGFAVDKVQFLPQEPVFICVSGGQNSLKQYIIEESQPRLLRERNGFCSPPFAITFYDDRHIFAISEKQLRDLSLLNEHQSCDFSYKMIQKVIQKTSVATSLRPFRAFACSSHRERDWCNVLTCHVGTPYPLLWSYENKTLGQKAVELKNTGSEVTAVEVSQCGTFGLAGFINGKIEKFTMQSGMHFLEFSGSHSGAVTSLKTDSLNRILISSGTDGFLRFWSFPTGRILREVQIGPAITALSLDRNSFLLAAVTEAKVQIYDIRTYELAREFDAESVVAVAFSSESRWLATAAARFIYIWDVPSSRLVDWVEFESEVSAVAFSPVGNYLATTHANSLGVFLWRNRAFTENVIVEKAPAAPRMMTGFDINHGKDFYSSKHINIDQLLKLTTEKPTVDIATDALPDAPEHRDISLSSLPLHRVLAISEIDEIKERNRPIEPPKKGEVPFFLPDSLNIVKAPAASDDSSHRTRNTEVPSELSQLLELPASALLVRLKGESPSKLNLDILQLSTPKDLALMCSFFVHCLQDRKDYDFVQGLLQCFLRAHGETLSAECKADVRQVKEAQEKVWRKLEEEFMRDISGLARAAGIAT